jgi:hypothetical protein
MEEQLVPTGVRVRYFVPGQATPLLVENVTSTDSTMTDGASQAVLYRITLQGQGTAAVDCDGQHFDTTVAAVTRCASSGQTGAATRCLSGSCP